MQKSPESLFPRMKTARSFFYARIMALLSVFLASAGFLFFPHTSALAAASALSKPASISGTSGAQQVSLNWGAVADATSYLINETDLANGQSVQIPTYDATTSASITGLLVGHWYRFSVIPVTDTEQGPASSTIDIRTIGFSGHYDNYYALGDSYSAGDGAQPYNGVKSCYRSTLSYAYLLTPGVPTPTMIACAGAVTADIDQVDQLPALPGTQLAQLKSHPVGNALITLTIGGNDIGFSSEMTKCITSFFSCTRDQATISQRITDLEPRLVQVYKEIRTAAPAADIFAVGYPLLVADPAIAHCHNAIVYAGLSYREKAMIRTLAAQLDDVIAQAATQAGVSYVTQQVEQDFAGHEACTAPKSAEWINEIAGLNDALHDSFHPNAVGYVAFAEAVDNARNILYTKSLVRS